MITVSAGNNVMFFMLCRSLSSFASHHEEAELTVHSGQYYFFLAHNYSGKPSVHCWEFRSKWGLHHFDDRDIGEPRGEAIDQ